MRGRPLIGRISERSVHGGAGGPGSSLITESKPLFLASRIALASVSLHNGLATLRGSLRPVSGSLYSFQLTGNMTLPVSLVAMMTPSSLLAVVR